MQITEILDQLKKLPPVPLTHDIKDKIEQIVKICDEEYSNKKWHGADALNRMILLDSRIADLLTPDVIRYLFTQKNPDDRVKTYRNDGMSSFIKDVIYYGFNNGLLAIKLLPNNELPGVDSVQKSKDNQRAYQENTLRIVTNIAQAADIPVAEIEAANESKLYENSLEDQFLEIIKKSKPKILEINKAAEIHEISISNKEDLIKISMENISRNLETSLDTIFRITGHQKKIFLFIIDRCLTRGMLSTGVIKGETLAQITQTSLKMVKTSIQRLIIKNLIVREKGKTGRGGFYSFRITEVVRNAALEYIRMVKLDNPLEINKEANGIQLEIKKESLIEKRNILPSAWEEINILPLEHIGFNKSHLIDIFETGLIESEIARESILHYSYGLEYESAKYKQYDNPLNVFIGRLRKGKAWFESNYRSPQELAQLELIEAKKNELDRIKKLGEEAYKLALSEWQEALTREEVEKIIVKNNPSDFMPQNSKLSLYFKEAVWPLKKTSYLIKE